MCEGKKAGCDKGFLVVTSCSKSDEFTENLRMGWGWGVGVGWGHFRSKTFYFVGEIFAKFEQGATPYFKGKCL